MSLQEKKAWFGLVTTILFMGGYVLYTFGIQGEKNLPQVDELKFWGTFMLTMMGVLIALKIAAFILFAIVMKGVHKDEDLDFMDDYDKQIEMRSDRNGNHIFLIGFICCFIPLAMEMSIAYMFVILLSFGFISGVISDASKLYYYKNGI